MTTDTKTKVLSNLIWRYAERSGAQFIQFFVSILLARMLTPADYGLVGLITVFISVANVFAQSGLGQALVQRKDAGKVEFSTVFFYSLGFSFLLYGVLCFIAPYIADFYESPQLIPIVRVLGLTVIINSFNGVQQAYVQKTMQFKRFFYSTLFGTGASVVVALYMAYNGFGVWALIGQQITNQLVNTVVLWFTVKWRPSLCFSFVQMKKLFSFGWKLLCSNLLDTVYQNMYSLIIGKFYTSSDLGYYNKGKSFPMLIINNINTALSSVLFPVMSEAQNEKERLKNMVRQSIKTATYVIFPLMVGLGAVAEPLVLVLLTEKWLPAVPFIRFCCFTYAFWPIHTSNLQAINAIGRSDIFLKLEIAKKTLGIITLVVTLPHGLMVMMSARCINAVISSVLNTFPNKKLINYSYFEQIKDILPSIVLSFIMLICVSLVSLISLTPLLQLIVQVIVGIVVYVGFSALTKNEMFYTILDVALKVLKRKK